MSVLSSCTDFLYRLLAHNCHFSCSHRTSIFSIVIALVEQMASLESIKPRAPRFSMGKRWSSAVMDAHNMPGPASYSPGKHHRSPAFTMGMRHDNVGTTSSSKKREDGPRKHNVGMLRLPPMQHNTAGGPWDARHVFFFIVTLADSNSNRADEWPILGAQY